MRLERQLREIRRCPHCAIANPQIILAHLPEKPFKNAADQDVARWGLYYCTSCGEGILARGQDNESGRVNPKVVTILPDIPGVEVDIPEPAHRYLEQAYETLHAPDAAAVMAGSAVDAMLKAKGYEEGSLYNRIDKAVEDHLLTQDMGKWAHAVRLESNRPRHSDRDSPHVSPDEAKQAVEFAAALGQFVFVLTARVAKGIADAEQVSGDDSAKE